jgi:hypothetical protein
LDVNLKLFDIMGRIALNGLWLVWADRRSGTLSGHPPTRGLHNPIHKLADRLCGLVAANPALLTPVADEQVIDIALAFLFLAAEGARWEELKTWISELVRRAAFSYRAAGGRYPCVFREYGDLADHPENRREGYFEEATAGSVLLPTLAFWAAALDEGQALATLARLREEVLPHCTMQLWLPDQDSEPLLWRGQDGHGAAFLLIPLVADGQKVLGYVLRECGADTPFNALSAVRQGFWPLVLLACRHYRLPVPPHFWASALPWVSMPPKTVLASRMPSASLINLLLTTSSIAVGVGLWITEQSDVNWDELAGGPTISRAAAASSGVLKSSPKKSARKTGQMKRPGNSRTTLRKRKPPPTEAS